MRNAVSVINLVKSYSKNASPAVNGISFEVAEGEVFGLLGPNGAGKTTTIGVLTTRVQPTSGQALVCGIDVARNPSLACGLFAVVPQRNNLDRSLNIRQNLLFHAAYHGVGRQERNRRADEILDLMGLTAQANSKADFISGGQAQRVMIGRALMHHPRVLFLDEPATGLDPQSRLFVHDRVMRLRSFGVTVVITTHDMEEATKLCDRVGIVDHGQMLAMDQPSTLTKGLPGQATVTVSVTLKGVPPEKVRDTLGTLTDIQRVERIVSAPKRPGGFGGPGGPPGGGPPRGGPPRGQARPPAPAGNAGEQVTVELPAVRPGAASAAGRPGAPGQPNPQAGDVPADAEFRLYTLVDPAGVLADVLNLVSSLGCEVTDLSLGTPSLEDVFVHLTGRDLR